MQLNEIFNAEDIEVLFAQWENVTGVKPYFWILMEV